MIDAGLETEQWNAIGLPIAVRIGNIAALDADIQPAAEAIGIAASKLVESVGIVNSIRKLI